VSLQTDAVLAQGHWIVRYASDSDHTDPGGSV